MRAMHTAANLRMPILFALLVLVVLLLLLSKLAFTAMLRCIHVQQRAERYLLANFAIRADVKCVGSPSSVVYVTYIANGSSLQAHNLRAHGAVAYTMWRSLRSLPTGDAQCMVLVHNQTESHRKLWKPYVLLSVMHAASAAAIYHDTDAFVYNNMLTAALGARFASNAYVYVQNDIATNCINSGVLWLPYHANTKRILHRWIALSATLHDDQKALDRLLIKHSNLVVLPHGHGADHYVGATQSKQIGPELSSVVFAIDNVYNICSSLYLGYLCVRFLVLSCRAAMHAVKHARAQTYIIKQLCAMAAFPIALEVLCAALFVPLRSQRICGRISNIKHSRLIPISDGYRTWQVNHKLLLYDGSCLYRALLSQLAIRNEIFSGVLFLLSRARFTYRFAIMLAIFIAYNTCTAR